MSVEHARGRTLISAILSTDQDEGERS
ncbi:hypothetical protein G9444_2124 [Rhodococcus erythropolis]|uniref:Uncharacterized protein n=1 Tax=Rhodococcus erythropolis TaxID=1833 RepID=A0A6G9CR55_RHOER|nr:hypothetical protein G9444_2124 [Rhodococcus erythropolis]